MIKTCDRVPSIYSSESRNFQLFGHLFDSMFNMSKLALDSILNIRNNNINPIIAELACKTVGFDVKGSYDSKSLIRVANIFKSLISNKGTEDSIVRAVNIVLNAQDINDITLISGFRYSEASDDKYNLQIFIPTNTQNIGLLEELFDYILPAGWLYTFIYKSIDKDTYNNLTDIVVNVSEKHITTSRENLGTLNYISHVDDDIIPNIGEINEVSQHDIPSVSVNIGTVYEK